MSLKDSEQAVAGYLGRRAHLGSVAGFAQQHTSVSMYTSSTVVRAPETVVRGRFDPSAPGFLGEELLLNHRRSGRDLGMQLGVSRFYAHDAVLSAAHSDLREQLDGAIALPRRQRLRCGLTSTVSARRSGRDFSGRPATASELATVLWHAQGISGRLPVGTPQDPEAAVPLRNAPSGGGLYPVRLAVLVQDVRGVPAGRYEYQPHSHTLRGIGDLATGRIDLADHLYAADIDLDRVSFALVYVYDLYVNSGKYGDSGMVFALIEVGGIAQNVHLARTGLGMTGCDQGGYDKQRLEALLGLDGTTRHVVHLTLLGHGAN